ncbi:MAG TPA: hypothetical protein VN256_00450 [Pyrinomonadaceae bacterium]|nr:hypothetical protein [Pyrinomonadaceae bacterium]
MTAAPKERTQLSDKVATVLVTALVIAVAAAVFVSLRQQLNSTGIYRADYEGKIVDKSATFLESQTGSRVARRLHIRKKDGEEFQVSVNESLYERALVGMWIKGNNEKAELTWEEPREPLRPEAPR